MLRKSFIHIFSLSVIMAITITMAPNESYAKSMSSIVQDNNILSVANWSVRKGDDFEELLCVISKEPSESTPKDSLPTRTLSIDRESHKRYIGIFKYETPDSLLTLFPAGEVNGRLIAIWVGGSNYHFTAFNYSNGKVEQVLGQGSKAFPELVIDQDENESIIITNLVIINGEWIRGPKADTDIY